MTLREIAMLKTFVKDRGMDEMFISLYTKYRLKENPVSIEQYLIDADAENVFMRAFYWITNSRFGYDYWQDFQRRWDWYREKKSDEYPMEDIRNFKGRAKSLRCNWDKQKFWHVDGRIDTAERYGMELSKEELEKIANEYERVGFDASTRTYGAGKDMRLANRELFEREKEENIETDPLAEFELIDISQTPRSHRRLGDDDVSLNLRNNGSKITFNLPVSKEIKARGSYKFAAIGQSKKGDVMLMLNDQNGVPVAYGKENVVIGSKTLCDKISSLLSLDTKAESYFVLKIREIAKTDSYVAYVISK